MERKAFLLRRSLQANAVFSGLSGLVLLFAAGPISSLLGINQRAILIAIGVGLVLYAAGLLRNAQRAVPDPKEASIAVAMDLAWVVGSGIVIALGILTAAGNWVVAIVADIVLLFAILQFVGIRRLRRQTSA